MQSTRTFRLQTEIIVIRSQLQGRAPTPSLNMRRGIVVSTTNNNAYICVFVCVIDYGFVCIRVIKAFRIQLYISFTASVYQPRAHFEILFHIDESPKRTNLLKYRFIICFRTHTQKLNYICLTFGYIENLMKVYIRYIHISLINDPAHICATIWFSFFFLSHYKC